jgi:hypothetical protein
MTPEELEATERRLMDINRRLGILSPHEISDEMPPELDAEELDELYEERDQLTKKLEEEAD